ncbi:hypothetical protein Hanom_Chr05g00436601 [Helianthus anomalus]
MKNIFLSILSLFIFLLFIFVLGSKSPVSLFFTEPILKSDLYGTIIWYQSLGGSFQFRFGRVFTGRPPETLN